MIDSNFSYFSLESILVDSNSQLDYKPYTQIWLTLIWVILAWSQSQLTPMVKLTPSFVLKFDWLPFQLYWLQCIELLFQIFFDSGWTNFRSISRLEVNSSWLRKLSVRSQFDSYVHFVLGIMYSRRRGWNFGLQIRKDVLLKFHPPDKNSAPDKIDRQIFFTV